MARISGVQSVHIAQITTLGDTLDTTEFGEVIKLPQFISWTSTANRADAAWYSEDSTEETFSQITDYELEFVVGNLSLEHRALISGGTLVPLQADIPAHVVYKKDDTQPEFAVIVKFSQQGNGKTGTVCQVYYRTKLNATSVEAETKTDSVTDSPFTITGKGIPLPDQTIMAQVDSYDAATSAVVSAWTTKPYGSL